MSRAVGGNSPYAAVPTLLKSKPKLEALKLLPEVTSLSGVSSSSQGRSPGWGQAGLGAEWRHTPNTSDCSRPTCPAAQWERACLPCGRPEFHPLGREHPLEEEMAHSPVFLPAEFSGRRSRAGCSPCGR